MRPAPPPPAVDASSALSEARIKEEIDHGFTTALRVRVQARLTELDKKLAFERSEYERHRRDYEQAQRDLAKNKEAKEALAKVRAMYERDTARKQIIDLLERSEL